MNNNMENLANAMIPSMVKFIILMGIILCLMSVTIAVYHFFTKNKSLKEIITYFCHTFGLGILLGLSGVLVNFVANFDISFSSFKYSVPVGYILLLVAFIAFAKNHNK